MRLLSCFDRGDPWIILNKVKKLVYSRSAASRVVTASLGFGFPVEAGIVVEH